MCPSYLDILPHADTWVVFWGYLQLPELLFWAVHATSGEFLIKDSVLSMPGPHCQALFFASGVMRVLGYDVQTRTPVKYFKIPNRTIRIETLGVNYWCGWTAFPAKLDNS